MKAKTITKHVVVLSDNEARLIYLALRHISKEDPESSEVIGLDRKMLEKLVGEFYELLRIR
ncbi:MAG: hypothetical protein DRP54_04970 [Spirochaetes bacterium]|nr:MAG: hypothetical protein DRP54_04970 [Spirochaetota bacterium]